MTGPCTAGFVFLGEGKKSSQESGLLFLFVFSTACYQGQALKNKRKNPLKQNPFVQNTIEECAVN